MKTCACGRQYDEVGWKRLQLLGTMDDGDGGTLELRNCPRPCYSTLSIQLATEPSIQDGA